jgi:Flp pilus assembly protein TadG
MFTLIELMLKASKGAQPIVSKGPASARLRFRSLPTDGTRKRFRFKAFKVLRGTEGSQLLELALSLPILLVLAVGAMDFGQAWNTKQKLANAVREGARIGASAPTQDYYSSSCSSPSASSPCTVQAVADSVKQYMVGASLNASCITPNSPSSSTGYTWTYTCTNGISMTVNRPYTFTVTGGALVMGTQVSLTYPYTWSLNNVLGLLPGGGNISLPSTISTTGTMVNLNNN